MSYLQSPKASTSEEVADFSRQNITKLELTKDLESLLEGKSREDLSVLRLSENNIKTFENFEVLVTSVLGHIDRLVCVDLSSNLLTEIDKSLTIFTNLKILLLHNNKIKNLSEIDKLKPMPSLLQVTFAGNPMAKDRKMYKKYVAFTLPKLTHLDFAPIGAHGGFSSSDSQDSVASVFAVKQLCDVSTSKIGTSESPIENNRKSVPDGLKSVATSFNEVTPVASEWNKTFDEKFKPSTAQNSLVGLDSIDDNCPRKLSKTTYVPACSRSQSGQKIDEVSREKQSPRSTTNNYESNDEEPDV